MDGDFKDYHERFEHEDALLTCFCGSWKNPFHSFFCRKAYAVSPVTGEAATRENLSLAIGIYWQRFIARIPRTSFHGLVRERHGARHSGNSTLTAVAPLTTLRGSYGVEGWKLAMATTLRGLRWTWTG
ncbi:hypothetical protein SMAC4_13862 [Sordaria macrospora]|uniref:uncharacterized protein n=1 Tax=Sordaria macrospora TaxID=5147 RepID=UPI002B2C7BCB|nr:hypothetical protein SMAC4_13862 [Sordaria macrospora]